MSKLFISISALAAFAVAGTAQAITLDLQVTDLFASTSPGVEVIGGDVFMDIGEVFEATIFISNPDEDDITSVFTFLTTDATIIDSTGALGSSVLTTPGAGVFDPDISLDPVGSAFGDQAVGQAAGTLVGTAHAAPAGDTTDAIGAPDAAVTLLFTALANGSFDMAQQDLATTVNGVTEAPVFTGGFTVFVPEAGAMASTLAAFGSVAGVVAVRRRTV